MGDRDLIPNLIVEIALLLVDQKQHVLIATTEARDETHLRLTVAARDISTVIGLNGMTIRSIRYLLAGLSRACGRKYTLELTVQDLVQIPVALPQIC